jgi:hypothetical protein
MSKVCLLITRFWAWPRSPAPSFGIVTLQHPSRKLVSQRVEVLAEVHLIVHPRLDPSNSREPTRLVRFLRDLFKQLLSDPEVVSRPSLLLPQPVEALSVFYLLAVFFHDLFLRFLLLMA